MSLANSPLEETLERVAQAKKLQVAGLHGSAAAFFIAHVSCRIPETVLVVAPNPESADLMHGDLNFFLHDPISRGEIHTFIFPGWDVEPYSGLSPHTNTTSQRLAILSALSEGTKAVVVLPASALARKVIPKRDLEASSFRLSVGQEIDRDTLRNGLTESGYLSTDTVEDFGCMSVRGSIFDLFPPAAKFPVRIEFFGDQVESIREFEPVSQRSINQLESLLVLPAREEILSKGNVAHAAQALRSLAESCGSPAHLRRQLVSDLRRGIYFSGIENHLSILHGDLQTVFDYAPPNRTRFIQIGQSDLMNGLQSHYNRIVSNFAGIDSKRQLVPPPESVFLQPEEVAARLEGYRTIAIEERADVADPSNLTRIPSQPTSALRDSLQSVENEGRMLQPLVDKVAKWQEGQNAIYIACRNNAQAHRLSVLLEPYDLNVPEAIPPPSLKDISNPAVRVSGPKLVIGELSTGFRIPESNLTIVSDQDIFGQKVKAPTLSKQLLRHSISSFSQLNRGDYVVHSTHGVGRFRGLTKLDLNGNPNDFLLVEYRDNDRLYLPVHRLNTLQKYVGQGGSSPSLDKMGGVTFARTKTRVKGNIVQMAHELLKLYAARAVQQGTAFDLERHLLEEFESTFPYEETADQQAAIQSVYQDLRSDRPMDRLICGDVGFGKTEIAIRAAFVAIHGGKQVAILVPTTVLALQHYRTISDRFKDYAINIGMLSRFTKPKEKTSLLERLKSGSIDIVVGTHRLLSEDVQYRDIGLLVIDEEHRFGVRHKERIKKLKKTLDVLTMTATPIPRTLHMAMSGLREFSLITTPPRDRLSIRTFRLPFSPTKIKEAIELEVRRGGQIFFVHNRVQSLNSIARFLHKILPEVRIGVAHGQMSERSLERVMIDFIEKKYDVLCCTAIIESGLDIPSANTIIINRADWLGLAQLYQLRGRVGRSAQRAYCYLLTPPNQTLATAAERRLKALVDYTELGAGFRIASEDLEMRGAGNLLGTSQSGSINSVGFAMYCELLEKAIQELKGEDTLDEIDPDIDLKIPAHFPDDYIADLHSRLYYYKLLSDAPDESTLYQRMEEIEDRFGAAPEVTQNLLLLMLIKLELKRMRIRALSYGSGQLKLRFDESSPVDRLRLVELVSSKPDRFKLSPDQRLQIRLNQSDYRDILQQLKNLLHLIG